MTWVTFAERRSKAAHQLGIVAVPVIQSSRRRTDPCGTSDGTFSRRAELTRQEAVEHGICGCGVCRRYLRVRAVLMEIFSEPPAQTLARVA